MANLQKQAEDLGIDIDRRWSDETLQEKIDEAKRKAGAKPPEETKPPEPKKAVDQTVPVRLLYDVWGANEARHKIGTVVDLPTNDAKRLIAEKKAERADPLPGEKH